VQLGQDRLALKHLAGTSQRLVDGVQEVLVPEWLGQELHRAGLHGLDTHRDVAVAGDEDDRDPVAGRRQLALQLQAVGADQAAQRLPHRLVVVDHEDRRRRARLGLGGGRFHGGRSTGGER